MIASEIHLINIVFQVYQELWSWIRSMINRASFILIPELDYILLS